MCFNIYIYLVFLFFKQKTAYEMRISDWSSDVCSSDLLRMEVAGAGGGRGDAAPAAPRDRREASREHVVEREVDGVRGPLVHDGDDVVERLATDGGDRKSVV